MGEFLGCKQTHSIVRRALWHHDFIDCPEQEREVFLPEILVLTFCQAHALVFQGKIFDLVRTETIFQPQAWACGFSAPFL